MRSYSFFFLLCSLVLLVLFNIFEIFNQFFFLRRHFSGSFEPVKCNSTIISLATFGSRFFKIEPTINSLLSQTFKVDSIVVNIALSSRTGDISKEDVYSLVTKEFGECSQSSINKIQCNGDLLFVFGPDLGPATKILGTLQMLPELDDNTCIVSVDDDVVYSENLVKVLVSNTPHDGVLGLSCEEIPFGLNLLRIFDPKIIWWQSIDSFDSWRLPFDNIVECKGWLHGWNGILYQKRFFASDVFLMDTAMPSGCFYADDVRLSGYLWTKGVKRYVYPHFSSYRCKGCGHQGKNASDSLSLITNTMQLKQLPCVEYFSWN